MNSHPLGIAKWARENWNAKWGHLNFERQCVESLEEYQQRIKNLVWLNKQAQKKRLRIIQQLQQQVPHDICTMINTCLEQLVDVQMSKHINKKSTRRIGTCSIPSIPGVIFTYNTNMIQKDEVELDAIENSVELTEGLVNIENAEDGNEDRGDCPASQTVDQRSSEILPLFFQFWSDGFEANTIGAAASLTVYQRSSEVVPFFFRFWSDGFEANTINSVNNI